mmetsp:Transcript_57765/g.172412  ORF Transcript_57765/g.172412 Transcript_57765/m.172412 type:complete len:227 (+) Transcript_57765:680-1360(+)
MHDGHRTVGFFNFVEARSIPVMDVAAAASLLLPSQLRNNRGGRRLRLLGIRSSCSGNLFFRGGKAPNLAEVHHGGVLLDENMRLLAAVIILFATSIILRRRERLSPRLAIILCYTPRPPPPRLAKSIVPPVFRNRRFLGWRAAPPIIIVITCSGSLEVDPSGSIAVAEYDPVHSTLSDLDVQFLHRHFHLLLRRIVLVVVVVQTMTQQIRSRERCQYRKDYRRRCR